MAEAVLCSQNTVRNVHRRFLEGGLQRALYDKERPGEPVKFTGGVEARLVMLACSDLPEGASCWTLPLLADKMVELGIVDSISYVAVGERLKNKLQPWKVKSWCIGKPSGSYVTKTEDVLDLYQRLMIRQRSTTALGFRDIVIIGTSSQDDPKTPEDERRDIVENWTKAFWNAALGLPREPNHPDYPSDTKVPMNVKKAAQYAAEAVKHVFDEYYKWDTHYFVGREDIVLAPAKRKN